MRRIKIIALVALVCSSVFSFGQKSSGYYHQQLAKLHQAIETAFYLPGENYYKETAELQPGKNAYSYLWPLCGLIQAANEIEVATADKNAMAKTMRIIGKYYDPAPPAPGYASYTIEKGGGDRFYDDNQWIGIACMDAYVRKKQASALATGKLIYRYMMTGYDTVLNGGLYWQENKKVSKNTCSNGPAAVLCMQLYKATGEKPYLDTAILIYNWTKKALLAPNGVYWDNVRIKDGRIGKAQFSYNTGTMLQSGLYLYEATKDKKYLVDAQRLADSSLTFFYGSGKFRDSYWFNAVLLRGYQHLLKHNSDMKYITAFKTCLNNALQNDVNEAGLLGKGKTADLVGQSGMLEILARFAQLEERYKW